MTTPTPTPSVEVTIAGKPTRLRFTAAAVWKIEDIYDDSMFSIIQRLGNAQSIRAKLLLDLVSASSGGVWTSEALSEALDSRELYGLIPSLVEAVTNAFPEASPNGTGPTAQ
jgi:hypothetical protein